MSIAIQWTTTDGEVVMSDVKGVHNKRTGIVLEGTSVIELVELLGAAIVGKDLVDVES